MRSAVLLIAAIIVGNITLMASDKEKEYSYSKATLVETHKSHAPHNHLNGALFVVKQGEVYLTLRCVTASWTGTQYHIDEWTVGSEVNVAKEERKHTLGYRIQRPQEGSLACELERKALTPGVVDEE